MGIIQKQAAWSSIITYVGVIIGFVNVAFLFTAYLSPAEMGMRGTLFQFCIIFHHLGLFGFSSVATRYFPTFENDKLTHNGYFSFILGGPLVVLIVISIALWSFEHVVFGAYEDNSKLFVENFYLVYPIVFFMVLSQVFESYSSVHYRTIFPTFVREIILKGGATVVILSYAFLDISSALFWQLYAGTYAVATLILAIYVATFKSFSISINWQFYRQLRLREIFTFAGFMVINSFASMLVLRIDILMIAGIIGEDLAGVYVIAVFMSSVIEIPRKSIAKISSQLISKSWHTNDLNTIQELYKKGAQVQFVAGVLVYLLIILNLRDFFEFIPQGEFYSQSYFVIIILGFSKLIDMVFSVNGEIIGYSKYYKFNLVSVLVLAVLAIFSNFFLIDFFGIEGAAFASVGSILVFNVIKYLFLKIKFGLEPFSIQILYILSLGGITFFIGTLIPSFVHPIISVICRSAVITISFVVPIYYLKLSKDFNKMVDGILWKFKNLL